MSLEEILQKQGLTQTETSNFIEALQRTYTTTKGMEGYRVTTETADILDALLKILRVPL